ncbi:protein ecdysoneless [Periplaneta americana]|uniref:protein ecdysoneless n=1 Tax=Periplaneta americana TaxID=6978 RepID=UPI0037E943A8
MAGVLETVREEDFVQYYLFPHEIEDVINANEEKEHELKVLLTQVESIVRKYAQNYIWHRDSFCVTPVTVPFLPLSSEHIDKGALPPHLYGSSHYGDNIEDEWFIVFMLLQLTKEIDGLVARVIDSDGEFLLIEAADYLPQWANPETCEQRVYLYQGAIHIVPLEQGSNKNIGLSVTDAVAQVRQHPQKTRASQEIQDAIKARIQGYPDKIAELIHRTNVYIPVGVAALLKEKPNLISPAVLAFCNRDPIDMKACRAMRYFPPENRVMTNVVFTKCLYAMITHHKFNPDRRTGWNIPPTNSADFKSHNLGVKLACGFEILVAQAKPASRGDKQSQSPVNLDGDHGWIQYLNSLKKTGYFKDLLEGSKEYQSLLSKAEEYYINHRDSMHCEPSIGQEILNLLSSIDYDIEEFKKAESSLPPPDDEKWLDLCPKDLDAMLEERYGPRKFVPTNSNSDPTNFTSQLAKFLDHMSGLDGAEFPRSEETTSETDTPPVRPKRGIKKGKGKGVSFAPDAISAEAGTSSPSSGNRISFDQESFSCAVQNILDFVIPEDSWDLESEGSGMSSYEDEMEMDLDQLKPGKGKKGEKPESELKQYMDQMDRELASTTMGQSFEKVGSKIKGKNTRSNTTDDDGFEDIEAFEPVDIDMNALKNILESYQSQMGGAGPATNMLGPMGVRLEPETTETAKPEES